MHDSIQSRLGASTVGNHHVAVRVSNLERAAKFFIDALGARWLSAPLPLDQSACHYLFDGPPGGSARFAFVGFDSPDQPAFELIEFIDVRDPLGPVPNWEAGFMHFCFTVADVDEAITRVEAAGGKRFRDVKRFGDPGAELTQVYFHDPDGNLFQFLSLSLSEVMERLQTLRDDT
jgi:catechol 2,3-dioxygenase-like lactoylglutathione lyase family enzyme